MVDEKSSINSHILKLNETIADQQVSIDTYIDRIRKLEYDLAFYTDQLRMHLHMQSRN